MNKKYTVWNSYNNTYPFSSDSLKECREWIEKYGNDIDCSIIP